MFSLKVLRHLMQPKLNLRCASLWEPDYLVLAKTKTPEYDEVNLQIRGFDYVVLERFQKIIHQIADGLGVDVCNGWAIPAQHLQVKRFRDNSSVVDMDLILRRYDRTVQIIDAKSHQLPILIDLITTACPPGVTLTVHEHTKDDEEIRFVPDLELIQLKETLTAMGDPRKTGS